MTTQKRNPELVDLLAPDVLLRNEPCFPLQYYSVKGFGAKGDGLTDDTAAIQAAINAAAFVNGTAFFQAGTYIVNNTGIIVPSNIEIELPEGAVVRAKVENFADQGIFRITGKTNVRIYGHGTIDGDKAGNAVGRIMGILINDSTNVRIEGLTIQNCPGSVAGGGTSGDAIYIWGSDTTGDIWIENCVLDANVRQGISITRGYNIHILHNRITNTSGNAPGHGIDIEANNAAHVLHDIFIKNNYFYNNQSGVVIDSSNLGTNDRRVVVEGNYFDYHRASVDLYIQGPCISVIGNIFNLVGVNVNAIGTSLATALGGIIEGNIIIGNGDAGQTGIQLYIGTIGVTISKNIIKDCTYPGIYLWNDNVAFTIKNIVITDNQLINCSTNGTGLPMIYVREAAAPDTVLRVIIRDNSMYDNRGAACADYGVRVDATAASKLTYSIPAAPDNIFDGPTVDIFGFP